MIEKVKQMPVTFTVGSLPVKMERNMIGLILGIAPLLMAFVARRRRPGRTWPAAFLVGWLYVLVALSVEIVHVMGHALSARQAGAPMDAVYVPVGFSRTIYYDNDVPPKVHIQRSLGGPIASALALLVSVVLFVSAPAGTLFRELVEIAVAGNAMIGLGSWLPIPGVDGAIMLYWWRKMRAGEPVSS